MSGMSMECEAQQDAAQDTDALVDKYPSGKVTLLNKSSDDGEEDDEEDEKPAPGCSPFFGVKHYLHSFYGLPNEQQAKLLGEEGFNTEEYNPPEQSCCFRFTLAVLVICTLTGICLLAFGFFWPPRRITVDTVNQITTEDDWTLVDRAAIEFNKHLDWLKLGGLGFVCLAGLMALCLLLVPICRAPEGRNYKRNKWIGWKLIHQSSEKSQVITSEAPIPVKETVKAIQPH